MTGVVAASISIGGWPRLFSTSQDGCILYLPKPPPARPSGFWFDSATIQSNLHKLFVTLTDPVINTFSASSPSFSSNRRTTFTWLPSSAQVIAVAL